MYKSLKINALLIILLGLYVQGKAQNLSLHISPVFGNEPIIEEKWFVSSNGDSMQFDNVRFYLSDIQFEMENGQTVTDTKKAHLIDIFDTSSLKIVFQNVDYQHYTKVKFNLGIDSATSVSGALGGDLDPTRGMYWAWQSGYINMKIEGRSPQCKTRKNVFQFHLGGYMFPFYAMRSLELPIKQFSVIARNESNREERSGTEGVVLTINLSKFFENINFTTQNSIMIPSKEAMLLADLSIQMFSIQAHEK